jgi:hypothetical protein
VKALRQAQCNAQAMETQALSQKEQATDSLTAALTQADGQRTLSECLAAAADSTTARRLFAAAGPCCNAKAKGESHVVV